jgi:1,4-alpha-glucan branching enzyme
MVLENEHNDAALLERGRANATAQWNDPWHHCVHVLLTGETDGYYGKFADDTLGRLARSFGEGFDAKLTYDAFMPFLQNHDQTGNRALGERLAALASPQALRLATASLLLSPQVPLLFMGEEIGARTPFLFFTDFHGELADAVREGRRREFSAFPKFSSGEARAAIPDPNAESTLAASKIRWDQADAQWLGWFSALLALRFEHIVPRIPGTQRGARFEALPPGGISVDWTLGDGSILRLRANFSADAAPRMKPGAGAVIHTEGECSAAGGLAPWSGVWSLEATR